LNEKRHVSLLSTLEQRGTERAGQGTYDLTIETRKQTRGLVIELRGAGR